VEPGSRWLVFLDDRGLGESLVRELRAGGAVVTTVAIGTEFDRVGEDAYLLDPSDRAAYESLWQALQRSDRVVHLWSATAKPSLELGFYSLLYLVQAIGEDPATLSVVTQAFGDVTGSESRCPLNATLSGACRVIAQEYPHLNVRLFDVEISTRSPIAPTVQMLVRDLLGTTPDSPIAYRGNRRWIETFERVNLAADATTTRIKPGGTYLITGGLGGIGLSLARHFADTAKVNLILISRSPLPETGEKANAIRHLQSRGTEVTVIPADVGDREVMQRVIVQAESRFGKIDGVVHSAGIAGGGTIALKTRDRAAAVLHAKIDGTLVLDELLDDLDFMVLGSSISSVLGGFGQIDYCAANAFLDAFARDRALRTGQFTVSINWDTWQSVGMAVETTVPEALKQRRQANLERGIHPNEGIEAFRRILASDLPQAIVCTKSLDAAIERSRDTDTLERELAGLSAASPQPPAQSHPRPDLDTPYVAPRTDTERAIAQIWQELLGIEAIGVDDDFFELGGHSLLGTQIVSRLRDRFEGDVPLNRFFATPTIAGLAASLSEDRAAETDIQPVQRDDSEQLISQLDRLSERDVDRLLGDLLAADATSDSHER
jgi:NAD(P)-dependent dehydrogenase (short-subunit alcohol dehydrogenase family)/acyl carrier protein